MRKEPTRKRINEVLEALGDSYALKVIDYEWCIHRDLGSGYDIEISGLDNRRKKLNIAVYVWRIRGRLETVEMIRNIRSIWQLRQVLNKIEWHYREDVYPLPLLYEWGTSA